MKMRDSNATSIGAKTRRLRVAHFTVSISSSFPLCYYGTEKCCFLYFLMRSLWENMLDTRRTYSTQGVQTSGYHCPQGFVAAHANLSFNVERYAGFLCLFLGLTQPQLGHVMKMVFFFRNRQCLRHRLKTIGISMTGHLLRTASLLTGPITTM